VDGGKAVAVTTQTNDPYGYWALVRHVNKFCEANGINPARISLLEFNAHYNSWSRRATFTVDGGEPISVEVPDRGQALTKEDLAPLLVAIRLAC
jgi:hypothetical protein